MKIKKQDLLEKAFFHENHAKPRTRREFLAQGLIGSSGMMIAPSLLGLVSEKALALNCSGDAPSNQLNPAFLCFDLGGGGNIAGGNVLVGKRNGQMDFLADYSSLGIPSGMHPRNPGQTNNEFGLVSNDF